MVVIGRVSVKLVDLPDETTLLPADNRAAIIGGRNIVDEYFGSHPSANFLDLDVLAYGPIVQSIIRRFDVYWNNDWSLPVDQLLDEPASKHSPSVSMVLLFETVDRGLDENDVRRWEIWQVAASAAITGDAIIFSDFSHMKRLDRCLVNKTYFNGDTRRKIIISTVFSLASGLITQVSVQSDPPVIFSTTACRRERRHVMVPWHPAMKRLVSSQVLWRTVSVCA